MTSAGTPPQERLLNLVIGLASTRRPVTRAQIYKNFAGYQDSASQSAFERLFERDKETLRRLGIPLKTGNLSEFDDDVGYYIDSTDYALPPLEFTPQQARVATLAARLWNDSAMQDAAARGVTKLRAIGASTGGMEPSAVDLNAGTTTPAFLTVLDAIGLRRAVSFKYRAASTGVETTRQVHPWRVEGRRGVWYLRGFDLDREDSRLYRLDRIIGNVRMRGPGEAYEIPAADSELSRSAHSDPIIAHVLVAPGRANALRLRARKITPIDEYPAPHLSGEEEGDWAPVPNDSDAAANLSVPEIPPSVRTSWAGGDVLELTEARFDTLVQSIAGLGEHALVLGPSDLREQIISRLQQAARVENGGN